MVMSHHGVSSYMTGGDTYSMPYRPVTAGADPMVHRYHTASDEGWKPKPKKSNVALSALVLLSFLYFLNILQSCIDDHMRQNQDHHHHGHYPYYGYQNITYPWPIWQVAVGRSNLQTPRTETVDEVYDESQEYTSEDSVEAEVDNSEKEPIERFLPDFPQMKTRINSKKQESIKIQDDHSMEKLTPIFDSKKLN